MTINLGNFTLLWTVDLKFQVEGVAPTSHSFSQKTKLNDISCGIKIWTDFSSILLQFTHFTDRRTEFSLLDCVCIPMQRSKKLENVAIVNALQPEDCTTSRQSFWAIFGQISTAHAHEVLFLSF